MCWQYFEISGCLKFIVSYFAPGVRRKCLQGDNCERPTNLCFPDSTPILATKLKLHIWQNDIVKKWNDKEWFWKTICFCYCNKINQINYTSSRWWITLWERNDIFEKRNAFRHTNEYGINFGFSNQRDPSKFLKCNLEFIFSRLSKIIA